MQIILPLHNLVRWAVLISGAFTLFRVYRGWLANQPWTPIERRAVTSFVIALDTQLLLGLTLYFITSDITRQALADFGAAMQTEALRFFALEHVLYMVVGIILAHIGSSVSKKELENKTKFRRVALWLSAATLLILIGMPWSRPLIRGF